MIRADALVVGGGPAGSTCARQLRRAGWDVLVVDRARFPRDKVCAGWVTPDVFRALELSPEDYAATGATLQPITTFRAGAMGRALVEARYPSVVSYGVLRREFDHVLLRRADARVQEDTPVETVRRTASTWVVNERFEAPVLIGAGGHFCPVARHLRGGPDTTRPVVAREAEFRAPSHTTDPMPPSLYFCSDLDGYGWCVPKGDYLNIGIGRRDHRDFARHVREFIAFLERQGIPAGDARAQWRGHAYLASGAGPRPLVDRGLLLVGDAAGLAYPESGEGIGPAVRSGRLAAETLIAAGGRLEVDDLEPYAAAIRDAHPPVVRRAGAAAGLSVPIGRLLLRSPAFVRHVVLDRWFLRTSGAHVH